MDGGGAHLHERLAATNPDKQNQSPRAFWGRTDSSGAQWKAGPANGRGGTAPGAARGIRAGSRALPVLGGGVRRAGSLLGGLRANGARVRRKETGPTNYSSDRSRLRSRRRSRLARGPALVTAAARSRRRDPAREQQPPRAGEKLRLTGPGRRDQSTGESRAPGRRGRDGASLVRRGRWRAERPALRSSR